MTSEPPPLSTAVRAVTLCAAGLLVAAGSAPAQEFQWPDEPENLEVLPDTIGPDGLRRVMGHFTEALGVRCSFCHDGEGDDLTEYDFASDDPEHKESARVMMRMVEAINSEHLENLEHEHAEGEGHAHGGTTLPPDARVNCVTCHRGAEEPVMIQDLLAGVIEEEGVGAAVKRYEELRDRYYGGFTYDFRVGPLSELARNLAAGGRVEAAVRIAELEVEHHPESYRAHFVLGQMQGKAGDREAAAGSLERAIELAPDEARPFLERQLERLRGG